MKGLILGLILCFNTNLLSQVEENPLPFVAPKIIFDTAATYPGGINALNQYLKNNLIYPEPKKTKGLQGFVAMKFTITKKGSITDITPINGVPGAPNFVKESIRLINRMPKWIPAKLKNKAVDSEYYLNIPFNLK